MIQVPASRHVLVRELIRTQSPGGADLCGQRCQITSCNHARPQAWNRSSHGTSATSLAGCECSCSWSGIKRAWGLSQAPTRSRQLHEFWASCVDRWHLVWLQPADREATGTSTARVRVWIVALSSMVRQSTRRWVLRLPSLNLAARPLRFDASPQAAKVLIAGGV